MALSERSRHSIYQAIAPLAGDEATGEMLAHFPNDEGGEAATSRQLDLRTAELRTELADLRTELRTEMADLRTELRTEMADLRTEVHDSMALLATELRREIHAGNMRLVAWFTVWSLMLNATLAGTMIAIMG